MLPWQPFLAFYIWGAHWRHLKNTTELSVCGGHAALCQITLTTCFGIPYTASAKTMVKFDIKESIIRLNVSMNMSLLHGVKSHNHHQIDLKYRLCLTGNVTSK